MLGLAVLFVMVIYFIFLILITKAFYRNAKNKWKSQKIALLFGLLGFSLVFLPVFWDYIPNRIYFNYLCKNDTQLQVYKTFDEWNAENIGVLETLVPLTNNEINTLAFNKLLKKNKLDLDPDYQGRVFGNTQYIVRYANQRIIFYESDPYFEKLNFHVKKVSYLLFDKEKQEIIVKISRVFSGPGNYFELGGDSIKVWLNSSCENNENNSMHDFAKQFKVFY
ncbi:MAG: hypothetical protein ACRCXK_11430 [Wohlfahrtiimonas sp.]